MVGAQPCWKLAYTGSVGSQSLTGIPVVRELRDGMTIGVGGWGPRRKPMALIREILRSDLNNLTIVAYGGPDVGMLCAAGQVDAEALAGTLFVGELALDGTLRPVRGVLPIAAWARRRVRFLRRRVVLWDRLKAALRPWRNR